MASRYREVYDSWLKDPEGFWGEAAKQIDWVKPADKVFDPDAGIYGRWFAGALCNTCYNCIDRHAEGGRGDQLALIYDSPITGAQQKLTYSQLLDEVSALAGVLQEMGVEKGDRVIVYMPMIPQAAFAMLACARIGAIHSVVFGGFAPNELATRIEDAQPKAILTASCGVEPGRIVEYKPLLDEAIELSSSKPDACLVFQREQAEASMIDGRDRDWAEAVAQAKADGKRADCVPVEATDPLYILYTSGTTGQPKGVIRDNGGHMVAMKWTMKNDLRHKTRGSLLGGIRCGLGRRPFLHRLRAAAARLHDSDVRGQAGWHAGRRARSGGSSPSTRSSVGAVHRAHRLSGDQEGRPERGADRSSMTCRVSGPCSWPASGADPGHPGSGRKTI